MKGFQIDGNGDLSIADGQIVPAADEELLCQTCRTVLGTNKGEWEYDKDEGINFHNVLKKKPDADVIKSEVLGGLRQVDGTFYLESFSCETDARTRKAKIKFTAVNADGSEIETEHEY